MKVQKTEKTHETERRITICPWMVWAGMKFKKSSRSSLAGYDHGFLTSYLIKDAGKAREIPRGHEHNGGSRERGGEIP